MHLPKLVGIGFIFTFNFEPQHQLEQTQVRPELGGGRKEFSMADADAFKDFEDTENFLSRCLLIFSLGLDLTYHLLHIPLSAERQSVLLHLLSGLRAEHGESVGRYIYVPNIKLFTNLLKLSFCSDVPISQFL